MSDIWLFLGSVDKRGIDMFFKSSKQNFLYVAGLAAMLSIVIGPVSLALPGDKKQPPTALTNTATIMSAMSRYQPNNGTTYCNFFLNDFANQVFSYSGFQKPNGSPKLANEIVAQLRTDSEWKSLFDRTKLTMLEQASETQTNQKLASACYDAQGLANQGYLVVFGYKDPLPWNPHGHVAFAVPGEVDGSTSWPFPVPQIAQAGGVYNGNTLVFSKGTLTWGFGPAKRDSDGFVIYVRK